MKIIIFGSTGMLGCYMYKYLCKYFEIITIKRSDFDIEKSSWNELNKIIHNIYNTDSNIIIINCAGVIPQKYLSDDYKKFIKINSLFPHILSNYCLKYNIKMIHITTDCVFDGEKGNYNIDDQHNSISLYGISKSIGEPENIMGIRTSIIGEEIYYKKSLLEWIISNKNNYINGYTNHYWNGVTCLQLAEYIHNIINNNSFWIGYKHICSKDIVSKYNICEYINDIYNLNINIKPCLSNLPKDMTLNGIIISNDSIYNQIIKQKEFNIY